MCGFETKRVLKIDRDRWIEINRGLRFVIRGFHVDYYRASINEFRRSRLPFLRRV